MQEPLNEEMLEQMYWEFDTERNKGTRSERDVFKGKMRFFANNGRVENNCNLREPFDLSRVVMPFVRVMELAHLSWAEREKIAAAVQECVRHHKGLMDEQELHRKSMCGQQKAPNVELRGRPLADGPA